MHRAPIITVALILASLAGIEAQSYLTNQVLDRYRRKASKGDISAQVSLGSWFYFGTGNVPKDRREAAKWLQMAAKQGNAEAQSFLGTLYTLGEGVPQNHREAAKWWKLAAAQGDAEARWGLGVLYRVGKGVPKDRRESAKWFQMAAVQGLTKAQYDLGVLYFVGEGVPQDFIKAYVWFSVAAARGHKKAAKQRNFLDDQIPPEQITQAQDLATEIYQRIESAKAAKSSR